MPRPRDSSTRSYELIWLVLIEGSKTWSELLEKTGLHRDTLSRRLKYLEGKDMIERVRNGRTVIYSIVKSEPPYMGWEIPWICIMMTQEDWDRKYDMLDSYIPVGFNARATMRRKVNEILNHPMNVELHKLLEEKEMLGEFIVGDMIENIRDPHCIECLERYSKLIKTKFDPIKDERCCPNCGLIIEIE